MIATSLFLMLVVQTGGAPRDRPPVEPWNTEAGRRHYQAWGLNPTNSQHLRNFGMALARAEDWRLSAQYLSYALEIEPGDAMAHGTLGTVLVRLGELEKAIVHLSRAVGLDSENDFFQQALARARRLKDRETDAIRLTEVVRANPRDARARLSLGFAWARAGRPAKAAEQFQAAIRIQPDNADARFHLGAVLDRSGQQIQAIAAYRDALELRPGWPLATRELAWLLATGPDQSPEASAEAVKLAESVCDRSGYRDPVNLDTLAAAYASAGRFEAAVRTATKAVRLARKAGQTSFAERSFKRLQIYQAGRSFRLPKGTRE